MAEYIAIAVVFGGISFDLALGFWEDYGRPWRRKPGTNGRWRTDAFVVLLFAALAVTGAVAVAATVLDGWTGARLVTTVMLGFIVLSATSVWVSGKVERQSRRRLADAAAELVEAAAKRTASAAARAEAASEDTRRAAHKTEVAAELVIQRLDAAEDAS